MAATVATSAVVRSGTLMKFYRRWIGAHALLFAGYNIRDEFNDTLRTQSNDGGTKQWSGIDKDMTDGMIVGGIVLLKTAVNSVFGAVVGATAPLSYPMTYYMYKDRVAQKYGWKI